MPCPNAVDTLATLMVVKIDPRVVLLLIAILGVVALSRCTEGDENYDDRGLSDLDY